MELSAKVAEEGASLDATSRGRLVEQPLPELLLRAFCEQYSGSLVLKTPQGGRFAVLFERGAPTRAHLADEPSALIRGVMESQLPPEQVQLCHDHSTAHAVTVFGALERLKLLPSGAVRLLFEKYLAEQVQHLAHLPEKTLYRFFPGTNCFDGYPGVACRIEPLSTVVECLTSLPNTDRYDRWLASSRRDAIVLRDVGQIADSELRGTLRLVVSRLRRHPDSLENLRLCRIASPAALVAAVYTLRNSGCTIERGSARPSQHAEPQSGVVRRPSGQSFQSIGARHSTVVGGDMSHAQTVRQMPAAFGQGSGSSLRPSVGPASQPRVTRVSGVPPGTASRSNASVPPGSQSPSTQLRGVNERDVEAKTLEAWMRSVDEERHRKRALAIAEKASALFPDNTRILFYRGCLESLAGMIGPATCTLRLVLQLDPDYLEAQRELNRLEHNSSQRRPGSSSLFARVRGDG